MENEGPVETGIKRRSLIKRAGIVGAGVAAWSSPTVTSLASRAYAGSVASACTTCSHDPSNTCFDQQQCGSQGPLGACFCANDANFKACSCYQNDFCDNRTPCDANGGCPGSQVCVHTCCDGNGYPALCFDPCDATQSTSTNKVSSGPTGAKA